MAPVWGREPLAALTAVKRRCQDGRLANEARTQPGQTTQFAGCAVSEPCWLVRDEQAIDASQAGAWKVSAWQGIVLCPWQSAYSQNVEIAGIAATRATPNNRAAM